MDEIGQRWAGETSAREHRALTISLTSSENLGYRTDCVSALRVFAQVRPVIRVGVMPCGAWSPRVLDVGVVAEYAAAG